MPIEGLNRAIQDAGRLFSEAGKKIGPREMQRILGAVQPPGASATAGPTLTSAEYQTLQSLDRTMMMPLALAAYEKFMRDARPQPAASVVQAASALSEATERRIELRADKKVWRTNYWPTVSFSGTSDGDPEFNLWAKDGCLAKLDAFLEATGRPSGARKLELESAVAWIVGQTPGHYLPSDQLKEADFERTTGIDLNGNGKLDPDVAYDFLAYGNLGRTDGKTDGVLDVGWWGECDNVAIAGILFEEPVNEVTRNGITFTPQDIKGLLTLIAASQAGGLEYALDRFDDAADEVTLKSGEVLRGRLPEVDIAELRSGRFGWINDRVTRVGFDKALKIQLEGGATRTITAAKIASISRESIEDSAAVFHEVLQRWLGDRRPFAMDHDRSAHVWNDNFDGANIVESTQIPTGIRPNQLNGFNGPWSGGKLTFVKTEILKGEDVQKRYSYWLEKKDGAVVNSGWMQGSDSPDFMHRPRVATPAFKGENPRNPCVRPEVVEELYRASLAHRPAQS